MSFMPLSAAAERLDISAPQLRRLIDEGFGPKAHRVGRRLIKVEESDLANYIEASVIRPATNAG
jgi:excisionase family DNA binding protein